MTRIVYCEGYHDRAFLAGLLETRFGLEPQVEDKSGRRIAQGRFGYTSRTGELITIVPCYGKDKILPIAKARLDSLPTEPLGILVLCSDDDSCASLVDCQARSASRRRTLEEHQDALRQENTAGNFTVTIESLTWACDSALTYAPPPQCLERLVVCALGETYTDRGLSASAWLSSRPEKPAEAESKAHMWTHMAGWFAAQGCDTFLRKVWSVAPIATALQRLLAQDWPVIERLCA